MPGPRPKLGLTTPVTATFPSELSALSAVSARTPLSAIPVFIKDEFANTTPITPPVAYMDFLKAMSPVAPEIKRSATISSSEDDSAHDSMPSTASSERTDCSCKCGNHGASSPTAATPSSYPTLPMSAPPTGATSFPSLLVPQSPAVSTADSPTAMRSPFSARSVRSPFDWEAALKARYSTDCRATKPSTKSVRHIREVVTRTVTYTPRMNPAPKGKRRRTHSECAKVQSAQPPQTQPAPATATRSNSA
ncbi:uncharacterized protein B0I36DRAFT_360419 [Microdochium trichocladiopsis]|uniref:Uncharacterized protein n=1 Tax=Microdochium trichocladiopsis TaxID=1682393 RepID=A0A9P9BSM3_9PEZI|nr:uncharacterized protein B0I36DRAFT_360419 [Microdochium trichocladiopsis]KAH7034965.1 hypothetical protein B0I36DRAFT_360419 [Microdochium trichocladiopsis]